MDLELFDVTASGRVNLGDLLKGVKYVQAEKSSDGLITLTPVNIRSASGRSTTASLPEDEPLPGV